MKVWNFRRSRDLSSKITSLFLDISKYRISRNLILSLPIWYSCFLLKYQKVLEIFEFLDSSRILFPHVIYVVESKSSQNMKTGRQSNRRRRWYSQIGQDPMAPPPNVKPAKMWYIATDECTIKRKKYRMQQTTGKS